MTARPGSVVNFCKTVLPLLHGKSDGRRISSGLCARLWPPTGGILSNRFADTTSFLVRRYEEIRREGGSAFHADRRRHRIGAMDHP